MNDSATIEPIQRRRPALPTAGSKAGLLVRLGLIVFASLLCGLVLPGLAAYWGGVFLYPATLQKVEQAHPDVAASMAHYDMQQKSLAAHIDALDRRLTLATTPDPRDESLRNYYEEVQRRPPPVSIQPFYLHIIMFFWPIMYACLGIVAFVIFPRGRWHKRAGWRRDLLLATAALFVFNVGPILFRATVIKSVGEGRKVFAYLNPDIDALSFAAQMFNFAVFAALLALIWMQWLEWAEQIREDVKEDSTLGRPTNAYLLEELSNQMLKLQTAIFVGSVGFVVYLKVFWDQIITHGDRRLLIEALNANVLWLITIVILSGPFAVAWRAWQQRRIMIVCNLLDREVSPDVISSKLAALEALKPTAAWNLTVSGLTVVGSFAIPILQAILRR